MSLPEGNTESHGQITRLIKEEADKMVSVCCKAPATPDRQLIVINDKHALSEPFPYICHHITKQYYSGQCSKCKGFIDFEEI